MKHNFFWVAQMSQFSQFHLVFYQLFGLWSLLAMQFCQCLPPQCWNCLMLSAMCLLLLHCLLQHNVRTFKWVWCGGSSLFKCRREVLCGEKKYRCKEVATLDVFSLLFINPLSYGVVSQALRKHLHHRRCWFRLSKPSYPCPDPAISARKPPCFAQGLVRIVGTFQLTSKYIYSHCLNSQDPQLFFLLTLPTSPAVC